ncbi:catalase domain-containing [Trichoderma arundinaceum]|uniref:Catalase domain-containing n=1 Tax=Trichoderma arundinaceum TaxID=490622 RepID=A0A395NYC8_TRIAR|nr:catalase domain-containing [Trichoderma arundinaceum]
MLHLDLISTLKDVFGRFANVRPSHAKGIFVTGSFTPTDEAKQLSAAPHFDSPSTPVIARFSLFTGIPDLPSTDPQANPHGFAVRFLIGDDVKTDIICQSSTLFPASTGETTLAVFRALRDNTVEEYIKNHPEAAAFLLEDRKTPKNFGTQSFYSINAFKFVNAAGKSVFIRYRWIPLSGRQFLTQSELEAKEPNFLFNELPGVFAQGPINFKLVAQVAEDDDITNDCTKIWPEDRKLVELGELSLTRVADKEELPPQKQTIVYSVVPGVQGIEPSDDPIIAARAAVYGTSGQTRRDAEAEA